MRTRPLRPARTSRSSRLLGLAPAAVAVAVSSALVLSVGPSAVADAVRGVTGHDIADRSVQGRDLAGDAIGSRHLRDGVVKGRHVKTGNISSRALRDGAVRRHDLAPALRQLLDGAAGGAGPTDGNVDEWKVATWTASRAGDGSASFQRTSTDSLPAHAVVEPLALEVTGDLSGCTGSGSNLIVRSTREGIPGGATYDIARGTTALSQIRLAGAPSQLRLDGQCWFMDGVTPPMGTRPEPFPDVTVSLTVRWTVPDRTPTTSFD